MVLNLEWRHRFLPWRDELPGHFYRHWVRLPLRASVTTDQLRSRRGSEAVVHPNATRHALGKQVASMAGSVAHSSCPRGRGRAHRPGAQSGAESIIFVNGVAAGARDRQHSEITLAASGIPGTRYEILMESYGCWTRPTCQPRRAAPS